MIGASEEQQESAPTDGTALLAQFLSDPDDGLRLEAARALGKLGPGAAVAVPGLTAALKERNLKLRLAAATALGSIGAAAAPAIPALAKAMTAAHLVLARLAAQALSRIGRPAVATLVDLLHSRDPYVRREAAWALGEIGPAAVDRAPEIPEPESSLADTKPDRRQTLTPVIPLSRQDVVIDWPPAARSNPHSSDPLAALKGALRDADPKVRAAAQQALRRIRLPLS
jgi:HEAT repeat protein